VSHQFLHTKQGYYGDFGGCYLPEGLIAPIAELKEAYYSFKKDKDFLNTYHRLLSQYVGRPTPLTEIKRFSHAVNGPRIFLKREDLLHTGAHKINNALGQCLLAKKMGKKRVIAETGAGQQGVATATVCAYLGLECVIYMGALDQQRQLPNVQRMQLLGAKLVSVTTGAQTLKEAVSSALRDWAETFSDTYYCLGSALGPHPYPDMVAYFQSVIGRETYQQCLLQLKKLPNVLVACVGGGSNAIGLFSHFIEDQEIELVGVEAGGVEMSLGNHAARFSALRKGVLHGCYTYVLQDREGQIAKTRSIAAGLDYPAVGPQHAALYDEQRAHYVSINDTQAMNAFKLLSHTEGIIPALESSHALAYVAEVAHTYPKDHIIVVNLSGRGDKDLPRLIETGVL